MTDAAAIDALLPQLHCRQCGFEGCRPYAEAIVAGEAGVDRCPPGGSATLMALAAAVGQSPPAMPAWSPHLDRRFVVQPEGCIGCTKCLPVCPTDALVGAPLQLHDVLAEHCTGCGLCVAACPVDCITPVPREAITATERELWRRRYQRHSEREPSLMTQALALADVPQDPASLQAEIAAAVARQAARRRDGSQ